ncbi:MAG: hypothetical protein LBT98_00515 [Puniceicoccales bacterium]|jgi:hypothetical protein|nr:hypothetical protein [Puniceicoccales bacterium]
MAKVDVDVVRRVLQRNEVDGEIIAQILEDLELEVSGDGEGKEDPAPPVKKQFVILVSDPDGKFQEDLFTGWVLQIPEDESPLEVNARLIRAAYEFNRSKKGSRDPARSITDVCEVVPAKVLRMQSVWVRTKEPVLLVRTDNRIPTMPAADRE